MRHLKTTLAVLGAVTVLVLAGNTVALAATGQGFLLGKSNSANKQTSLARTTNGPVLKLTNKNPGAAPLVVNGRGRVTNLNSDKVDGYDSPALRNRAYVYTGSVGTATLDYIAELPVPNGTYTFGYTAMLDEVTPGNWVFCHVVRTRGVIKTYYGVNHFNSGDIDPGLSGAGVVTKAAGDKLEFHCGAEDTFVLPPGYPLQIALSPTSVAGSATLGNQAVRQR